MNLTTQLKGVKEIVLKKIIFLKVSFSFIIFKYTQRLYFRYRLFMNNVMLIQFKSIIN